MWNGTATQFEEASAHESDLNDRQRRILDLIERGHTNREIADLLGISVDGAKWNVSEILGKLGFESREDAAEYWRWRRRRMPRATRSMRALLSLPVVKWAGWSSALLVAAVALGAWAASPSPAPRGTGAVEPFYLEARESVAVVVGPEEPREAVMRWSYQDEDHFRSEYERILPWFQSGTSVHAADGAMERSYSPEYNEYFERAIEPLLAWQRVRPTPTILIGPAPAGSMPDLMTALAHWDEGSEWVDNGVKRVRPAPPPPVRKGTEILMGRNVEVIEYVRGTLWVDPSDMVIYKHVSGHFTVEVTSFDAHPAFTPDTFTLSKPTGASGEGASPARIGSTGNPSVPGSTNEIEVTDETGATRLMHFPGLGPGAYAPTFVPEAWEFREGGGNDDYVEWVLRPPGWPGNPGQEPLSGDFIRIEQATGFAAIPRGILANSDFERIARGNASESRTWIAEGDRLIRITASGAGLAFLDRVAQEMTVVLHP